MRSSLVEGRCVGLHAGNDQKVCFAAPTTWLYAVQPGIVNFALIQPGDTEEEREMNAKYCVSIARKLGCFLFLVSFASLQLSIFTSWTA